MAEPEAPGRRRRTGRATIQDVARRAGVSIATVSRVLNSSAAVDAALAERVRAACDALQYQPNRAARALAGGRSAIIGMLVTDIQNPFFMDILRGAEDTLQQNGYLLVLCNTAEDPRRERAYIEVLCAESIAGALVVPARERPSALSLFGKHGIPVVAIDRRVGDRSVDAVLIDNVAAAYEAVAHLIAQAYRRIGIIVGPANTTTAHERLAGYRRALIDSGIAPDPRLERFGLFSAGSGQSLAEELLTVAPPIDALFTANNRLTQGALAALHAHGLQVPEDIAVVGFDEVPWGLPGSVSLTTVTQPAYELGSVAANRLLQRLQHPDTRARQEIILAHHLRIGDSSRRRVQAGL